MDKTNTHPPQQRPGENHSISDEEFDRLLEYGWDQIALFSFKSYTKPGRGVVFFNRQGHEKDILEDGVDLGYAVYEPDKPDLETSRLIKAYDPKWEIIFQYQQPDGHIRTIRIRTGPENLNPWGKYLFDRLMMDETEKS